MAITYLPFIDKPDYEAFRRLLHGDMPDTHDKWLYLHAKSVANIKGEGGEVELIKVSPDEFTRYCDRVGAKRDIHALGAIAFNKASGKEY